MSARRHSHACLTGLLALCCLAFAGLAPAGASASTGPQWTVTAVSIPTNFAPGDHTGNDHYQVTVMNTGDGASDGSTITIADTLPAGLTLDSAGASGTERYSANALACTGATCSYSGVVIPEDALVVTVPVDVASSPPSAVTNLVSVSGGGAAGVSASTPTTISSTPAGWGIASFSEVLSSTQAGAHADQTTNFAFNTTDAVGNAAANLKDTVVDLPVGVAGNPGAAPTCSAAQLADIFASVTACPGDSQVGTITVGISFVGTQGFITAPVYNMQPQPGDVARLGFNTAIVQSNIAITVRPGDYGLRATAPNLVGTFPIDSVSLSVWGIPTDPSHDSWRNVNCTSSSSSAFPCRTPSGSPGQSSTLPPVPFLSNPTQCTAAPLTATLSVTSYQQRDQLQSAPSSLGPMIGCDRLRFDPLFTAVPTTVSASAPTGLDVGISIPQTYGNAAALATANLKDAVVTLPEGMTLNPSAGAGLGACTPDQYASETATSLAGEGCPNNSELGTVTIHTPVLTEQATGHVYLAQPYVNPFGSLLAVYIVARVPARGIIVRAAGMVTPDPVTGRLVATFKDNPQLPFDLFTLSFRQGQTSPLISPPTCGLYITQADLTPWSDPAAVFTDMSPFTLSNGFDGGACPAGGVPPFTPQVTAGGLSNKAGSYSPFYVRLSRTDAEQEISSFSTSLALGLTGNLSGIPFCSEAQIALARTNTGNQETGSPSCPAASQIGHTSVGTGVASILAYVPGKVYLAGPYHGLPFSVVSITSATVGPFDLGTVVVRFALRIDPYTAQVSVDSAGSDPIPHIIQGIVTHVRDIRVYIDRPGFTLNPTNCNPLQINSTLTSNLGQSVTVSSPFQVANCAVLPFTPKFSVSTSGKTSRKNGASLSVKLTYPAGRQANIKSVKVDLPIQLPSRLTTLQKACTDAVFNANPANCPAASLIGHAKAITPIVPVPLEGPVYFVSHGGAAFPDLVIVLQGYGVTVNLVGTTFINSKGITSSTFKAIPDVPVGSFQLTLPQGPFSALATNGNLCRSKLAMPTAFTAQNGAVIHQTTPISVTGCPKAKKAAKHRKRKSKKKGKRK